LPGQVVGGPPAGDGGRRGAQVSEPASSVVPEALRPAEEQVAEVAEAPPKGRGRGRGRGRARTGAASEAAPEAIVAAEKPQAQPAAAPSGDGGLPTDADGVSRYIVAHFSGVGKRTAEQLIEAVGAENVFRVLQSEPARVREVLGAGKRSDLVLTGWEADRARRGASAPAPAAGPESAEPEQETDGGLAKRGGRRGTRGGRGRGGAPRASKPEAEAAPPAAARPGGGRGRPRAAAQPEPVTAPTPEAAAESGRPRRTRGRRGGRRNGRKKAPGAGA
jgi:hypothetical protein